MLRLGWIKIELLCCIVNDQEDSSPCIEVCAIQFKVGMLRSTRNEEFLTEIHLHIQSSVRHATSNYDPKCEEDNTTFISQKLRRKDCCYKFLYKRRILFIILLHLVKFKIHLNYWGVVETFLRFQFFAPSIDSCTLRWLLLIIITSWELYRT